MNAKHEPSVAVPVSVFKKSFRKYVFTCAFLVYYEWRWMFLSNFICIFLRISTFQRNSFVISVYESNKVLASGGFSGFLINDA